MKHSLIVGGSNGIGLSLAIQLAKTCEQVSIVDRYEPTIHIGDNVCFEKVNLLNNDFSFLNRHQQIDTLVITAGFGRICNFNQIHEKEIDNSFQVNTISLFRILHFYFNRMQQTTPFYCAVMGSIAGLVVSPLFSLYSATKAAVCKGIESLNIELEMAGTRNRILNVSPGSIKGTKFDGGDNHVEMTESLAKEILLHMNQQQTIFIPQYNEIFKGVIERYNTDAHLFGVDSYHYKKEGGRMTTKPQLKVGYLSGTFDLFHIGHLNMLRRAKEYCDFLAVGIHKDASHKGKTTFIPFEERVSIVKNISYVDMVFQSEPEDCDVWTKGIVKYDFLFVGSDYKGSERFNRYEDFFKDKGVSIIYFPYTQGTSSTQLREALDKLTK